jgi:hypothetical protein
MLSNTELGPVCPVCSSEMWEFADVHDFTEDNNREPQHEVTASAECFDCESVFELDLQLDKNSRFRELKIKTVSPPQGFGWGTPNLPAVDNKHVLHIWGDMNDSEGTQYQDKYHLQNVTVVNNNED